MNNFSERFKELKELKKSSYPQIATNLGLQPRTVKGYASGTIKPSYDALIALADYFDVSLDYLTGRTDCPDIVTKDKDGNFVVVKAMQPHKD